MLINLIIKLINLFIYITIHIFFYMYIKQNIQIKVQNSSINTLCIYIQHIQTNLSYLLKSLKLVYNLSQNFISSVSVAQTANTVIFLKILQSF